MSGAFFRDGWVVLVGETPYRSLVDSPAGSFLVCWSEEQAKSIVERLEASFKKIARIVRVRVEEEQ